MALPILGINLPDPVTLLRASFLTAAATIIFFTLLPPLSRRFLAYGPREYSNPKSSATTAATVAAAAAADASASDEKDDNDAASSEAHQSGSSGVGTRQTPSTPEQPQRLETATALDHLAAIRVPHSWFRHFYTVSVLSSAFWALQIRTNGVVYRSIAESVLSSLSPSSPQLTMTIEEAALAWLLMLFQSMRRLYESQTFNKAASSSSSSSTMFVGHWLLGIGFYVLTNIAIWIDAIPAIEAYRVNQQFDPAQLYSIRSLVLLLAFLSSSFSQHAIHAYLYRLPSAPNYVFPEIPQFANSVTPHYAKECEIYLILSLLGAAHRSTISISIFCVFIFVAVNLGVTANATRQWYIDRFGKDKVGSRARMFKPLW